jgi:hypothetical protein
MASTPCGAGTQLMIAATPTKTGRVTTLSGFWAFWGSIENFHEG